MVRRSEPSLGPEERELQAAFDQLVSEHLETAYRLALAILRDPSDAADVTQDAYLLAWSRRSALRDRERIEAWLTRIVINACRDRLRRRRRIVFVPLSASDGTGSADPYARVAERDRLERAFARLEADDRIVLVLRYRTDLSVAAIAARTGLAEGTVKSRLHRARQLLRQALEVGDEP